MNYAGIVTYNPDIDRLKENIAAILSQNCKLYIVDNNSKNYSEFKALFNDGNVEFYHNDTNKGIAQALNVIMELSKNDGAKWTLLLDQDSVSPTNLIQSYNNYVTLNKAGVLCPQIYDKNTNNKTSHDKNVIPIGICLTSGSYVNVSVWEKVGKFREELFIDSVDTEFSIRLFFKGYKTYRINEVILNHELGKSQSKIIKSVTNHNSMRRYYIARNSILVANYFKQFLREEHFPPKEKHKLNEFFDWHISPFRTYMRQFQFIFLVALYEKDKLNKILAVIKGLIDGNKMKLKEL